MLLNVEKISFDIKSSCEGWENRLRFSFGFEVIKFHEFVRKPYRI